MKEINRPIVMEFPLRGEWLAPNTPGTRVPSHGTNRFGTRYAFDFVQVDWNRAGRPAYRAGVFQYLFGNVPINRYYCWGQAVYAPCGGVVACAQDGYAERPETSLFSDMSNAYKNGHSFDPQKDSVQSIAGNYVIIDCGCNIYAALVHLQTGSIQVSAGQRIETGAMLGRIGHSGNSYMPHLHFQLMDSSDITTANGLPCAFREYEVFQSGTWQTVKNGIPTNKERLRFRKAV